MSQPGTLAAALAFVPNWWQETADPFALRPLLTSWSKACGWRACGLCCPLRLSADRENHPGAEVFGDTPPLEVPDAHAAHPRR